MTANPALTFAIALIAGVIAQSLARHLRIPGIVLLLLTGAVLGPEALGLVHPDTLGAGLELLVGFSVAIVLFEGGLNLKLERVRREAQTIRRLITLGAFVSLAGGMLAARYVLGWDWRTAVLFGSLITVTGPTVTLPLLRRIRVTPNIATILEAEAVLIDPIGAIVAVVALEVVLATTAQAAAFGLLGIPARLFTGTSLGVLGGIGMGLLLRHERIVPAGLENIFALSLVLVLYTFGNAAVPESGILAATVAGLVVGNMRTHLERELREFKEQLTVLLVGLLFVLLAADVRLAEVTGLGWAGVATVLLVMFVIRPVGVALCTHGSALTWRERAFIAWLGPRGIVAAAVASLFAQALLDRGIPLGGELRALVFFVIATTVIVQGLSGGPIAGALGIRRRTDTGYIVVGANPLGRALAHALGAAGEEIVLIDNNATEVRAAEEEGLPVILGSANEEGPLIRADIEGRRGFVTVTTNEGLNLLLARHAKELFRVRRTYVTVHRAKAGIQPSHVHEAGASVLFGGPIDVQQWIHRVRQQAVTTQHWRYAGEADGGAPQKGRDGVALAGLLPLVIVRRGTAMPAGDDIRIQPGDVVTLLVQREAAAAVRDRLVADGWEPAPADARARAA
ncbi:MAG TPA: cation:proton antiporter [Longimicrobiales bacterium]